MWMMPLHLHVNQKSDYDDDDVYSYWRDANNYQQEKTHLFYKIIHFFVQFSAIVNRFIVKTELNSTFTNDLKRK